jgi:hypothetical protein
MGTESRYILSEHRWWWFRRGITQAVLKMQVFKDPLFTRIYFHSNFRGDAQNFREGRKLAWLRSYTKPIDRPTAGSIVQRVFTKHPPSSYLNVASLIGGDPLPVDVAPLPSICFCVFGVVKPIACREDYKARDERAAKRGPYCNRTSGRYEGPILEQL